MVVCSEMADDLERTVEGIAEDEKADQQNDYSRQDKTRSTAILLSCAKLGKCPSFCRAKFLLVLRVVS